MRANIFLKHRKLSKKKDPLRKIKIAIWAYLLLLIFEGALRKWVLPGLSSALLIVRDPVAIYIIALTFKMNIWPKRQMLTGFIIIAVVSMLLALIVGHGSILVAAFGGRIYLLHLPIIFIIGKVLNREDILEIGKVLMAIAILMSLIIASQFYSPQSAWINRAVGGDEGGGFSGAAGYFRPSGTFSFTNGLSLFYGFVTPFILYFLINFDKAHKLLTIGAAVALIAAIPLSISRAILFQVSLSVIFLLIAFSRKPKYFGRILGGVIAISIIFLVLQKLTFFQTGTAVFRTRFENANKAEGGLEGVFIDRFLGGLWYSLSHTSSLSVFGAGIGYGTNVAGMLLTGQRKFLSGEGEWGRILGELGFLFGMLVIILRTSLAVSLTFKAFRRVANNDFLPWLMASFAFLVIAQGLWSQPTAQGFAVMIGGLLMASLKTVRKKHIVKKMTPASPAVSIIEPST